MNSWPKFYKIRQIFDQPEVFNLQDEIRKEIDYIVENNRLEKGARVAITAGSRGVANIVIIMQTIVERLKQLGFQPFLFSAMGSHGGGTKEGQQEILTSLGLTEESVGCPVIASTELVQLGVTEEGLKGLPVYASKEAVEADGILLVNRVKAHTSFVGPHESGLVKMMAVGMGRAKGASFVHGLGAEKLAESIPSIAKVTLEKSPVIGGLALIENSNEKTAKIKGILKEDIFSEEKQLLIESKTYLPKLPAKDLDFAVVMEMGKNFSGTGMDTNVIGRIRIDGIPEPTETNIKLLAVLDLSEESHGNANGVGLADFTTEKFVQKVDRKSTYLNCITSGFLIRAAIPMTLPTEKDIFNTVLQVLRLEDSLKIRATIIKNTLHLDEMWVSESVYEELKTRDNIEVIEGPFELSFKEGMLELE